MKTRGNKSIYETGDMRSCELVRAVDWLKFQQHVVACSALAREATKGQQGGFTPLALGQDQ